MGYSGYSHGVLWVLTWGTLGTHMGYSGYSWATAHREGRELRLAAAEVLAGVRIVSDAHLAQNGARPLREEPAAETPPHAAADGPLQRLARYRGSFRGSAALQHARQSVIRPGLETRHIRHGGVGTIHCPWHAAELVWNDAVEAVISHVTATSAALARLGTARPGPARHGPARPGACLCKLLSVWFVFAHSALYTRLHTRPPASPQARLERKRGYWLHHPEEGFRLQRKRGYSRGTQGVLKRALRAGAIHTAVRCPHQRPLEPTLCTRAKREARLTEA